MKNTSKSTSALSEVKSTSGIKSLAKANDAIRERAYHIYLNSGSLDKHDNWIQAEKEHKLNM